jgi:thioredoxin-like negative regulator of GroEL
VDGHELRPQLLFVGSHTSGASRKAEALLAQVLQTRKNHQAFRLRFSDADDRPDLVERLRVAVIPSLLVVENNRVKARVANPRASKEISEAFAPWLR